MQQKADVDLQRGAVAEGSLNTKQQLRRILEVYPVSRWKKNKEQIAKLQSMLKNRQ